MSTFYKLDSTRVTAREYWWENKSPLFLVAMALKFLRVRIPGSTDDPPTESLAPFEVLQDSLPIDVRGAFQPMVFELGLAGFHSPVFHAISDSRHNTHYYFANFTDKSGKTLARIQLRVWNAGQAVRRRISTAFVTEFADGTFLVSTSARPDLAAPVNHHVHRLQGVSPSGLWAAHQRELASQSMLKRIAPVTFHELRDFAERYHVQLRDFHLARGVFAQLTESERKTAKAVAESSQRATAAGLQHPEVLAEIEQLQNKKVTWSNVILVLVVSLLLFLAAGAKQWNWKTLCLIIPVLFIHELGHYLAMLVFRYRNLRMFFIPFFGAAVMGQNYNVPGWKKAVVSLMGPVPGICLGAVLGVIGMITKEDLLLKSALMLLIINGMNLLPVLPLDGGWVLHTILFSRHPVLDVAFRVIALFGLFALAIFGSTRTLVYVGIPMVLGLPLAYKLARITASLRERHVGATSEDAQTIPPETAEQIISEVKVAFPKFNAKLIAQQTLQIFETLNARPPGVVASLALLAVHGVSLVTALIFGVLFAVASQGDFVGFVRAAALQPQHSLSCDSMQMAGGPKADRVGPARSTIVATFQNRAKAQDGYAAARARLPEAGTLRLMGDSVLLTLPSADDSGRKKWFGEFSTKTTNTFVDSTNLHAGLTLTCLAQSAEVAKEIEEEISEYRTADRYMRLIPPWQPGDDRSSAERAQHRKARQTFARLQRTAYSYTTNAAFRASLARVKRAQQLGDTAELKSIQAEQRELMKQLVAKERNALRAQGAEKVDLALIDQYCALPSFTGTNYQVYRKALASLSPRMGQLPEPGTTSNPDRFATRSGLVTRSGLLLTFQWLTFDELNEGFPALTEWLCAKGCRDMKYEFHQGFADSADDDTEM